MAIDRPSEMSPRKPGKPDYPTQAPAPQIEQEWQPPELSNKKIDKTKDQPHARQFKD